MNIEIPSPHIQLGKQGWVRGNQVPEEALARVASEKKSPHFSVAQFSYLPGMGVLIVLLPPSKSFVDKNIIPIKLP